MTEVTRQPLSEYSQPIVNVNPGTRKFNVIIAEFATRRTPPWESPYDHGGY